MKRKVLAGLLISAMALSTSVVGFAEDTGVEMQRNYFFREVIQPYFVGIMSAKMDLSFKGAEAIAKITVKPKRADAIDSVSVSVKLMKKGSNTAIKTWDQKLGKDSVNSFSFRESIKVASGGTYYTKATIKCYKNGKVIDTINDESEQVVYK